LGFRSEFGAERPRGLTQFVGLSVAEIVSALVLLGALRALTETVRVDLTAKAQLGIVQRFRLELLEHLLDREPAVLLRWPPGELASRIQVEVRGIQTLLQLGLIQGIRSTLVATALATVALGVDTTLAIPGLLMLPFAVAAPLVELAAALGIGLVLLFAWSTRGELSLAETGTVLVALILMYRPLHGLAQAVFGWSSGLASLDRLDELLSFPSPPASCCRRVQSQSIP
jgi:ABC-type multidrug transport system fused ATPase/permease subunit